MARFFDGIDDFMTAVSVTPFLGPTTSLTVAFWFRHQTGGDSGGGIFVVEGTYGVNREGANNHVLYPNMSGSWGYHDLNADASEEFSNQWCFAVLTWTSGEAFRMRAWDLDGNAILDESEASATTGTIGTDTPDSVRLGITASPFDENWNGRLANLYVHNEKLADADITKLRTGVGAPPEPSVDFWPLNDSGSTETGVINGLVFNATGTTAQADRTGVPDIVFGQVVTPESVIARNGWTDTAEATSDAAVIAALQSSALEDAASPYNPVGDGSDTLKVRLASLLAADGITAKYSYRKQLAGMDKAQNVTVQLRSPDGSTLLDEWTHTNIGTTAVPVTQDISAEALSGQHQVWFVPSS